MAAESPRRKHIAKHVETSVLAKSARRCALCVHLKGDLAEKKGQVAHLDRNRVNAKEDNLAWLCLEHHSEFDSSTSQHKGYTIEEVKFWRSRLYDLIESGRHLGADPAASAPHRADRETFRSFLQAMPSDGVIGFIRDHDFGAAFFDSDLDEFRRYCFSRPNPADAYLDEELEALRQNFLTACSTFRKAIGTFMHREQTGSGILLLRIPAERRHREPERYEKEQDATNTAALALCQAYDTLVQRARAKLA
ncbi:MAG: hypothetical protein U0Q16_36195 [Bryobacteraceae bacterium]